MFETFVFRVIILAKNENVDFLLNFLYISSLYFIMDSGTHFILGLHKVRVLRYCFMCLHYLEEKNHVISKCVFIVKTTKAHLLQVIYL